MSSDFTFGPRHRMVTRTYRFPFVRACLGILVMAALGVFLLLASFGAHAGTADVPQLKAAAERLNDRCRGQADAMTACDLRDKALHELRGQGVCWNSKASTPATLWGLCPVQTVDGQLAQCAKVASQLDSITRFRNTGVPPGMVVQWGFPAEAVRAVYSGQVSSYRGAAYCYTLRNVQDARGAVAARS